MAIQVKPIESTGTDFKKCVHSNTDSDFFVHSGMNKRQRYFDDMLEAIISEYEEPAYANILDGSSETSNAMLIDSLFEHWKAAIQKGINWYYKENIAPLSLFHNDASHILTLRDKQYNKAGLDTLAYISSFSLTEAVSVSEDMGKMYTSILVKGKTLKQGHQYKRAVLILPCYRCGDEMLLIKKCIDYFKKQRRATPSVKRLYAKMYCVVPIMNGQLLYVNLADGQYYVARRFNIEDIKVHLEQTLTKEQWGYFRMITEALKNPYIADTYRTYEKGYHCLSKLEGDPLFNYMTKLCEYYDIKQKFMSCIERSK